MKLETYLFISLISFCLYRLLTLRNIVPVNLWMLMIAALCFNTKGTEGTGDTKVY